MIDERLRQIFEDLTAINATSGNEAPVAEYIKAFAERLGLEFEMDGAASLSGGNSGNAIVRIKGGGNHYLASHMDTPRSIEGLKRLYLEDRITSDGTTPLGIDDRGGLSSILYALEKAVADRTVKPCTLVFTVCEETSLAGSTFYTPDPGIRYGFIFDSYMSPPALVSETCGLLEFDFTFRGRSSHAGIAPEKGISAIQVACEAITRFPYGKLGEKDTGNIGRISGGTATNVVCDEVKVSGEIRSGNLEEGERRFRKVVEDFEEVCRKHGATLEYRSAWDFTPYHIHPEDEPYRHFEKVVKSMGLEPLPMKSMGGSDANAMNKKGIKTINLGVGAQNPHGNDEFILYEDFTRAAQIAYGLMTITLE